MELINPFTNRSLSLKVSVDYGQLWCAEEVKRMPHISTGLLQEIVCFIRPGILLASCLAVKTDVSVVMAV
jgi:hypothetical protein